MCVCAYVLICARESIWFLSRCCPLSSSRPRALALAHTPCSCSRVLSVIFRVRALLCSLVCLYVSHSPSLSLTFSFPPFLPTFFLSIFPLSRGLSICFLVLPHSCSPAFSFSHTLSCALSLAFFSALPLFGQSYLARAHSRSRTNHALTHTHHIHMHTRTQKYIHACTQK